MADRPPPPPGFQYDDGGPAAGLLEAGNIDLLHRPRVKNRDGSISTVRSIGVNIDGREVLLPTVSDDGRIMSNREAIETFKRTGKHLGMFDSPQHSTAYAQSLHNDQAKLIDTPQASGAMPPPPPGFEFVKPPEDRSELRNAPQPTLKDKAKVLAMRSATGGMFDSWDDASSWFFGSKERNDLKAEGVGMAAPTPAELTEYGASMLAPELAPGLMPVAGAERAAGAGRMARIATNPKTLAAAEGALPGVLHRNPQQAVEGAAAGLLLGHLIGGRRVPEGPQGVPHAVPEPTFPASMTRKEAEAATTALINAGKSGESRALIEAIRGGRVRLTEAPPVASQASGGAPSAPQRPSGPHPGPGNVKPATIYQPEGTSFTMNRPEGQAAEAAGKLTPQNQALAERQQALIGADVDNPLIRPTGEGSGHVEARRPRQSGSPGSRRAALLRQGVRPARKT